MCYQVKKRGPNPTEQREKRRILVVYEQPPGSQAKVTARMREAPAEPEVLGIPLHRRAQQSCSSVPCFLQHWLLCPPVCGSAKHSLRATKSLEFASRLFMEMDPQRPAAFCSLLLTQGHCKVSQGCRAVLCLMVVSFPKFTAKSPQNPPTLVSLSVDISCRDCQGSAIYLEDTDASAGKPMASQAVLIFNSCKQIRQCLKQETFMVTAAILTLDKSHLSK